MPEVGRVLGGRYRLVELVGQGGMATIYRAQDGQLSRDVAIKILRGEYGVDAAFVVRFRREAQAAAQLNHPNVVAVFDYGTDLVGPYIVMELVTGGDLAAVLRERGRLPPTAAARIGQQIGDALDAAHARGIVHRDIKPSNVLLSSGGRVKVADFGIAQAFSEAQLTLTAPGMTMGSVHYFSPEQARGEVVTTASDVYSAGLVLYEMITGQRAFMGDSAAAVAMARLTGQIPSPAAVRRDVPLPLDAIVRWALQPDARNRPTAAELSSALGRYLADPHGTSGYAAAPTQPPPPPTSSLYAPAAADPQPSSGRWGMLAALLGLFVLVLAGVLVFLVIASNAGGGSHPTATPHAGRTPPPTGSVGATQFPTPLLAGLTLDDARTIAANAQLRLVPQYVITDQQPVDTVLSQQPVAGAPILPGSTVVIDVAKLSDTVVVPDLHNETADSAVQAISAAGLTPGTQFQIYNANVPLGLVVKTDPRASQEVARGTSVDYWLSRGPRPTPSPLGSSLPTQTPTPKPSRTPKPTHKPTPPPVATPTPGPTPITVGNYGCEDLATARGQIEAVGLTLGTVTPDSPPRDDSWLVIDQTPNADVEVFSGTVVDLTVVDPTTPCP
jgi:beta-lactam-binding protein with PASTA domain